MRIVEAETLIEMPVNCEWFLLEKERHAQSRWHNIFPDISEQINETLNNRAKEDRGKEMNNDHDESQRSTFQTPFLITTRIAKKLSIHVE